MEVTDIPLTYKLKFWYWSDEECLSDVPAWWKSYLKNIDLGDAMARREILSQYASLSKSIHLPLTMTVVEFRSHEHLTQFILKYC